MRIFFSLFLICELAFGDDGFSPRGFTAIWDTTTASGILNSGGTWDNSFAGWNYDGAGVANSRFCPGCNVSFGWTTGSTGPAGTVTVTGTQLINSMTFNPVGSGNYTLSGGTLSCVNTSACTYTANVAATIGSDISGSKGLIKNGNQTLSLTADLTRTGTVDINAGTLSLVQGGAVGTYNYRGGQININGASTLSVLAGGATRYDFPTMTFNFDNVGGGTITSTGLNWVQQGIWTFQTNGGLRNTISGTSGLNMDGDSILFSVIPGFDVISDLDVTTHLWNGGGGVTKTGGGILRFISNSNAYSGGTTTVSDGTLALGDGNVTGNIIPTANTIANNATLTYNTPSAISHSGVISGTGTFTKQGTGTLTLSGNNLYTGNTTVAAGTLSLGDGTKTLYIIPAANTITDNATLTYNTPSPITHSGVISGPGIFTKQGTGTLTLSGINTYTGNTTVTGGILQLGDGIVTGNIIPEANLISDNATLAFNTPADISHSGAISGTGIFNKLGNATLTLSAANTYTGVTNVNAGTLKLTNTSTSPTFNITAGKVLELNTPSGTREGGSNQTFNGAGILRKTGANAIKWGATIGTFALGSGALIDVQEGIFTGGSFGNDVWTSNLSDLNVESGASFDGVESNVRVDALSGTGTISSGHTLGTYTAFTFGVDNGGGTFSGVLANTPGEVGKYTKAGNGNIILANNNTYTGLTTVSAGTLTLGDGTVTGNIIPATNLFTNNAALVYNTPSSIAHSGVISGSGTFTKEGTGFLTLSGNNLYTGNTTVSAGTLSLGNGTTTNYIIPAANTITTNATLTYNTPSTITHDGAISGTGTFTKDGTGNLTLSNKNPFSGGAEISRGTVTLTNASNNGTSGIGTGTVTIRSGATLSCITGDNCLGHGDTARIPIVDIDGGTFTPNTPHSGGIWFEVINFLNGGLEDGANGINARNIPNGGAFAAAINVSASPNTATISGKITHDITVGSFVLTVNDGAASPDLLISGVITGPGTGPITKAGAGELVLSGANTYTAQTNVTAGTLQATTNVSSLPANVSISAGALAWLNVTGTQTYPNTFSGAGTLKVTAGGTGATTTALSGNLSGLTGTLDVFPYSGGGGKVNVSTATQGSTMPAGSLVRVQPGGTIFYPSNLNFAAGVELNGGTTGETIGNLRVDNGTVTGPVTLLANSTIGANPGGSTGTIAGVISGAGFGITKESTGNIVLANNNTYTGTTTVTGGTLTLGNGTRTGNIIFETNLITNNSALAYNTPSTITHSGIISGSGTFEKSGTGVLTLTGAHTYTGNTTVTGGTLSLGDGTAGGNIIPAVNLITDNATLTYNTASDITHSGAISGTGKLNKEGTGTVTLTGSNSYTGTTTVNAGALQISNGTTGTLGNNSNTYVASSASLIFNQSSPTSYTYGGNLTGSGSVLKNNTSTQVLLSGNNSAFAGDVNITSGALRVVTSNSGSALASWNISSGATLTPNTGSTSYSFGSISGAGSIPAGGGANGITLVVGALNTNTTLSGPIDPGATTMAVTKVGTGTWTLSGANLYTGNTTISAGTLQIDGTGSLASGSYAGAISIVSPGTFKYSSSTDQTLSGAITGTGQMIKDTASTSTLTLTSGSTNYSGATTVSAGTLALTNTTSFASAIANNATLNLNRTVAGSGSRSAIAGNAVTGTGTVNINGAANTAGTTSGGWVTFNGGTGSYSGTGPVNVNSGVLARDNVSINTINSTSDFTIAANAVFGAGRGANSNIGGLYGAGTVSSAWVSGSTGSITFGNGNKDGTFSGVMRGSGNTTDGNIDGGILNVIKTGTGTQILSGSPHTYTGTTTVNAGTLEFQSTTTGGTTFPSNMSVVPGATITFNRTGNYGPNNATTYSGLSGAGSVIVNGINSTTSLLVNGGWTMFNGAVNFSGSIDVQSGILASQSGATWTGTTASLNVAAGAQFLCHVADAIVDELTGAGTIGTGYNPAQTLTVGNGGSSGTFSGVIAGNGVGTNNVDIGAGVLSLTKTGAGTQTLTGVNTYTGATTINGGTLLIGGAGSLGSAGSYAGAISIVSPGTFKYSSSAAQILSGAITGTGALIKDTSSTSMLTLSGADTYSGSTTLSAGTLKLSQVGNGFISSTSVASGTTLELYSTTGVDTMMLAYNNNVSTLISGTGTINKTGAGWIQGDANAFRDFGGMINIQAGTLGSAFNRGIFGKAGSTMDVDISAGARFDLRNAGASAAMIDQLSGAGSVVNTWAGSSTLTLGTSNGSSTFPGLIKGAGGGTNNTSDDAGVNSLTKIGTGMVTLSGANTYTGTTTVSNGTLKLIPPAFATTARTYTVNTPGILNIDGTNDFPTGTTTFSGTGTLLFTGGNFKNVTGPGRAITMSMGSGALIDIPAGVSMVNGGWQAITWTNNFADMNLEGTFDVWNGNTVTVDALNGSGTIDKGDATASTYNFTLGRDGGSGTFSGTFTNTSGAGAISVTKAGGGTQTFTGANNYSGTTTISGGTLVLGNGTASGAIIPTGNTIANSGALIYNTASTISHSGAISGAGTFTKQGTGTITLSGVNSYTGDTTVTGGTLSIGNGATTGSIIPGANNIATNATLIFNTISDITHSGVISGTGTVIKRGTGKLSVSGVNSFSGGLTISQGDWSQSNNLSSGTGTVSLGDASTGANNISWTFQGGGAPANPIVVNNQGTGTVTIGTNSGGTFTNHNALITLNRATTINDATADRTTLLGKISGPVGTLTLSGSRVTLDNAANDFVGNIIVSSGTILQNNNQTAIPIATNITINGSGGFRINTGGTHLIGGFESASTTSYLDIVAGGNATLSFGLNNFGGTFAGVISNGSNILSLIKNGTGTQILSGNNTFTGGIILKGGTIRAGNINGFGTAPVVCQAPCTTGTCTVNRGGFATPNTITTNGLCTLI